MSTIYRPEIVIEDHLDYLDCLRDSGETNMHGAGAYLTKAFHVSKYQAREILAYWMKTFSDRNPQG